ncbi:hypothetical protein PgNI_05204 [Pyricularia grisea]|uniref:Cytochrome P450 n=1 Tax=Pyricularia grisea TaxID=148305 RepID=A0A6P8B7E0_PYRGI|nr:hypothetical protein PgNI_05204 [Pyricularia grisea]TLD11190.1 hypothetical protein PgNI_05204 [Pyricularia grisea]
MASLLSTALFIGLLIILSHLWRLGQNIIRARRLKLPYITVSVDQSSLLWMVSMMPLRPVVEGFLPSSVYRRLKLTTFDWEWHEKRQPFLDYAGAGKTFVIAGCGSLFEVWTVDPEIAADVLSRANEFHLSQLGTSLLGAMGPNVLSTNGKAWSAQRRLLQQVVNERISKMAFEESLAQTRGMLDEVAEGGKQHYFEAEGLLGIANKFAINVLSATVMGINSPWADGAANQPPPPGFQTTFMGSVGILLSGIPGTFVLPRTLLLSWPRWAPGYEWMRRMGTAKTEFPQHVARLLKAERDGMQLHGGDDVAEAGKRSNILSQLLRASELGNTKESGPDRDADQKQPLLSELSLTSNLLVITGAGYDTSANSISYVLLLLARYPEWQDWLFEEIVKIAPKIEEHHNECDYDYAAVYPRAIRVQAFLHETLRLFTPLPRIHRDSQSAQTVRSSNGPLTLPAGTRVHIDLVALHLDPGVWRNIHRGSDPPFVAAVGSKYGTPCEEDELAFRPSRWLNADGTLFRPPRGSYLAWGGGGRICPGQKMSQVEIAAFMIMLLRKCEVKPQPLPEETEAEVHSRLDAAMQDSEWNPTLHMRKAAGVSLVERL